MTDNMDEQLPQGSMRRTPIKLAPLNEQQRIVDKIEELFSDLDAGIAALERVKANLKRYRASILKAAVEGRLTEAWRKAHPDTEPADQLLQRILQERRQRWLTDQLDRWRTKQQAKGWSQEKITQAEPKQRKQVLAKYKEPTQPDTTNLPELPEGWCWATLDSIAMIVGGITKGQKRKSQLETNPYPYLRVANVQRGYLDLSVVKKIEATDSELKQYILQWGDALFTEGGDRDKLGRGWLWEDQIKNCIHQNHVFRARLLDSCIQPKLISWCGNSYGKEWFMKAGKQSVNLASINLTILKSFPVPIAPIDEQIDIVSIVEDKLSVIDVIEQTLEKQIQRSTRLRQSILKQAFAGKLVPQDPNDEPAEKLLERIRAEREQAAPVKSGRGRKAKR